MKLLVTDGVHAGTASAGSDDNCSDEHATGDRPTFSDAMTLTVLAGLDTLIQGWTVQVSDSVAETVLMCDNHRYT